MTQARHQMEVGPEQIQVLMAHIIIFNTWGYINSFGVFQVYHVQHLHRPPSDISWVGSIHIFLLFSIGTVSGRASDAGYFKQAFAAGLLMQLIGLFMTSLSKTYWQLFLAQGICTGIGNDLLFCPSLAVLTTYFLKRRAIAVGIAAWRTDAGGVVFPPTAQHLFTTNCLWLDSPHYGIHHACYDDIPLLIIGSRLPPRTTSVLIGPPIGGALIQTDHGCYLGAQLFFRSVLLVALGFLMAL
jgi:hypothetical protein